MATIAEQITTMMAMRNTNNQDSKMLMNAMAYADIKGELLIWGIPEAENPMARRSCALKYPDGSAILIISDPDEDPDFVFRIGEADRIATTAWIHAKRKGWIPQKV